MSSYKQRERRRLSAYASNDNRISRDYLKIISFSLVALATLISFMIWFEAFRPVAEYQENRVSIPIDDIAQGQYKRFIWNHKPIIIYHRTAEDIAQMQAADEAADKDELSASSPLKLRSYDMNWTVIKAQCQNLGCQPKFNQSRFICGCDGSIYDASGRFLEGRSKEDIPVIPWSFSDDKESIIITKENAYE